MSGDMQSNIKNAHSAAPSPTDLLQVINSNRALAPEGDLIERNPDTLVQLWPRLSKFFEAASTLESQSFVDEVRRSLREIKDYLDPESRSFDTVVGELVDSRTEWSDRDFDPRLRHLGDYPIEIHGSVIRASKSECAATLVCPAGSPELILVLKDPPMSDFKYEAINLSIGVIAHGSTAEETIKALLRQSRLERRLRASFFSPDSDGNFSRVVNNGFLSAYLDAQPDDSLLDHYRSSADAASDKPEPVIRILDNAAQ
jgi:hypothetical protein